MSDLTPGTLRIVAMLFKWQHDVGETLDGFGSAEEYLCAAADAWAADRARLEAAERLLKKSSVVHLSDGRRGCYFCDGDTVPSASPIPHSDDCPMVALARSTNDLNPPPGAVEDVEGGVQGG